jgi:AcrR family transcriptional regulator
MANEGKPAAQQPENGGKTRSRHRAASGEAVRTKIKSISTDLITRYGYSNVTFLDIGRAAGVNHSLIHYHFGNKAKLTMEILGDFAQMGKDENREIWCNSSTTLGEKFAAARDRIYRRFSQFNSDGSVDRPIGLLSRLALDMAILPDDMRKLVRDTLHEIDQYLLRAIQIAVERGELRIDTPQYALMLQISSVIYLAGPTARHGWEFRRLDDHFHGLLLTIYRAFGSSPNEPVAWPPLSDAARGGKSAGA